MIDCHVLYRLAETLNERRGAAPDSSYVASLYHKGTDAICKKIAEEAAETIMAAKDEDRLHIVRETADIVVPQPGSAGAFRPWPGRRAGRVAPAARGISRHRREESPDWDG